MNYPPLKDTAPTSTTPSSATVSTRTSRSETRHSSPPASWSTVTATMASLGLVSAGPGRWIQTLENGSIRWALASDGRWRWTITSRRDQPRDLTVASPWLLRHVTPQTFPAGSTVTIDASRVTAYNVHGANLLGLLNAWVSAERTW